MTLGDELVDLAAGSIELGEGGDTPVIGYGPPAGLPVLRSVLAAFEGVQAAEVVLTTGSSMALVAALVGLKRPGSVLCPRPFYPGYPRVMEFLNLNPIFYNLSSDTAFQPEPAQVARAIRPDVRAFLLNVPSNPTGAVADDDRLVELGRIASRHGLTVIADEVYSGFVYERSHPDLQRFFEPARLIRLRSFSKTFALPGQRLGYALGVPAVVEELARCHWTLALAAPLAAQVAALRLLQEPAAAHQQVAERRLRLAGLRQLALELLSARLGPVRPPDGGIFFWLPAGDSANSGLELAADCASRAGVLVQGGAAFGIIQPAYVRASFAVSEARVEVAFQRLADYLALRRAVTK